jgi:hypothetical protein
MRKTQKDRAAEAQAGDLHISGKYRRDPWAYLGMPVKIYPARVDGSLWKLVYPRGTIATARSSQPLTDLARRQRWAVEYPRGK